MINELETLDLVALSDHEMTEIDGGIGPFVAGLLVGGAFGAGIVIGVAAVLVIKAALD